MSNPTQAQIDKLTVNLDRWNDIVNGSASETVALDDFTVKTVAGYLEELRSYQVKGAWLTGTSYILKDIVVEATILYVCTEAHTAGTFATDLADGKWAVYQLDLTGPIVFNDDLTVDSPTFHVDSLNNKVGIGKTTPVAKLDILADTNMEAIRTTHGGVSLLSGGYPTLCSNTYTFGNTNDYKNILANASVGMGIISPMRTDDSLTTGGVFVKDGDAVADTEFAFSDFNVALAWTTDGRVGIGTKTPSSQLHVVSSDTVLQSRLESTATDAYVEYRLHGRKANVTNIGLFGYNYVNDVFFLGYDSGVSTKGININSDGNVAIGTLSPEAKLDVAGKAKSTVNSSIIVEIGDVSDFPAAVGGVISLVANTTYVIRGTVDLGTDRIEITQEGIKLMGNSLERDILTSDTTSAVITTQDVSLEITGLTLKATNSSSTILDATNYTGGAYNDGRDKDLIIQNCQITDCYNVWDIDGYDLVDLQNVRIRYVKATSHGCKFRSTSKIQITSCELIRWFDVDTLPTPSGYATVPMLEFDDNAGQAGFGAINITGCVIHPQQTQDGIFINANSTTSFGTISSNTFVTVGLTTGEIFNPTPASGGYSLTSTYTFDIFTNQGLRNSEGSILTTVNSNATITALAVNTPTAIALGGNAVTQNSLRFTADTNAVITYDGTKEIYVSLSATIHYVKQNTGNASYSFYIYKDSGSGFTLLPGSLSRIGDVAQGVNGPLTLSYSDTASPGDIYAIYVENTDNGDDILIDDLQFLIKE